MKIIQLNVWHFKYGEKILEFLKNENPDIVHMQEVAEGELSIHADKSINWFEKIKKECGFNGVYAPKYSLWRSGKRIGGVGNALLTKYDILDYHIQFFRNAPIKNILECNDVEFSPKGTMTYLSSLKVPVNFISSTLSGNGKIFRSLTTHFSVSQYGTETLKVLEESEEIVHFLRNSKDIPTIFSADCNLSKDSEIMTRFAEKSGLSFVNADSKVTLNPKIHAFFKDNIGNDPVVDLIFQKGFRVLSSKTPEITISDHLPVIAELDFV